MKRRQAFTQNTVAQVRQRTKNNVIMSNVGYDFKGTFIDRTSTKYKAKIGSDVRLVSLIPPLWFPQSLTVTRASMSFSSRLGLSLSKETVGSRT